MNHRRCFTLFVLVALVLAPSVTLAAYGTNTGPPEQGQALVNYDITLPDELTPVPILASNAPATAAQFESYTNLTTRANERVGPTVVEQAASPIFAWTEDLNTYMVGVEHDVGQLTEAEITEVLDLVGEQSFQVALNCPRPPAMMAESIKETIVTGACVCCYKAGKVVCDC